MILDIYTEVLIVAATMNYWVSKGYTAKVNTKIQVKTEDLPEKSNIQVNCKCNSCGRKYLQRYSRNKEICGSCVLSNRMKNNDYFKHKKPKLIPPSKKEFIKQLNSFDMNKSKLAIHYKTSVTTINLWLKKYDITLEKHIGRKYFKSADQELKTVKKIQQKVKEGKILSEISRELNLPRHIISMLREKSSIEIKTFFDVTKDQYQDVLDKMSFYTEENKKKNLKTIADENNISIEHLKKAFRESNVNVRLHSYNKSKGELEVQEFIQSLGETCYSAMIDKKYEIDCYAPNKRFGLEYCGEFWHRYVKTKNNKYYHKKKMEFIKNKNITILTIFESEWISKKSIVESIIRSKLGYTHKIQARKCQLKTIGKNEAKIFHEANHISGYSNSSINLGLYYGDKLVSVLSMIKSRFDKEYEYEISRFSSLLGHTVVGGLSRLFSYFVKTYNPKSCMTYSDLRFGEGKSYEKIGFNYIRNTVPNYYYYHKNRMYLESRMKYQKHKLVQLPEYSPSKTEQEIMIDAGYYILYDCGNKKYGWRNPTHIVENV